MARKILEMNNDALSRKINHKSYMIRSLRYRLKTIDTEVASTQHFYNINKIGRAHV